MTYDPHLDAHLSWWAAIRAMRLKRIYDGVSKPIQSDPVEMTVAAIRRAEEDLLNTARAYQTARHNKSPVTGSASRAFDRAWRRLVRLEREAARIAQMEEAA